MKVLRYAFLSGFVLEFMTAVAIALVAVTLGVRVISGNMPFEEAFVVLLLTPEFYKPLRELGAHRHAGMEGSAAADRIFEVLNTPVPVRAGFAELLDLASGRNHRRVLRRRLHVSRKRATGALGLVSLVCRPGPGPRSSGAAGRARARS